MNPLQLLSKLAPINYGWWHDAKQKLITWKDKEFDNPRIFEENCRITKHEEVWAHGGGTCWDLTLLIYQALCKSNSCEQVQAFYVECQNKKRELVSTHTAVLFKEPTNRQFFWFEFSWWQHRGIHGPFESPDRFFKEFEKTFIYPDNKSMSFLTKSFDVDALLKMDRISTTDFLNIARKEK